MAKKKGRRESIIAVGELFDLYDSVLELLVGLQSSFNCLPSFLLKSIFSLTFALKALSLFIYLFNFANIQDKNKKKSDSHTVR